uniref:Uncharacterized protein n=1 Tax=Oryza meridionalis TaxID=40149 RepID=A0A0E0F7Q7_9ORYZ
MGEWSGLWRDEVLDHKFDEVMRFSCSPVAGRGLPAGGGGGDGPSGGGAGGASAETHGVAGCPPRRSLLHILKPATE